MRASCFLFMSFGWFNVIQCKIPESAHAFACYNNTCTHGPVPGRKVTGIDGLFVQRNPGLPAVSVTETDLASIAHFHHDPWAPRPVKSFRRVLRHDSLFAFLQHYHPHYAVIVHCSHSILFVANGGYTYGRS